MFSRPVGPDGLATRIDMSKLPAPKIRCPECPVQRCGVQSARYMFSVLVQPVSIGHTVRLGRLLPPTTGEERMPLHRRMPYGPYSLASYLRRLHPRPLHGSGGLRSAPRGEAD